MASKKIMVDIMVVDKNATRTINKTTKAVNELAESTENLNNQRGKNPRAQAGLSNAILIETGRVASDANFGIMGVANNFGRLIELFQEFSRTNAGGVNEAFKRLGKSLMGVGGIIVGVQLFLSFAPRLFKMLGEWLSKTTSLTKAIKEGSKSFIEQTSNLTVYAKKLQDSNTSESERANILASVKEEYEGVNLVLDENNKLTDESNMALERYLELQKQRAIFEATLEKIAEKQIEKNEKLNSNLYESSSALSLFGRTLFSGFNFLNVTGNLVSDIADNVSELDEEIQMLYDSLKVPPPEIKKSGIGKIVRQFKEGLFDISQFRLRYEKEANKIFKFNEQERLDLDEEFAKKEADRKLARFIQAQKKRLEEYKEQVKDRKGAGKLIADAEKELNNSIEDAKEKHGNAVLAIEDAFITKRILLADKEANLRVASERKIEDMQLDSLKQRAGANEVYYNAKLAQVNSDIELDSLALSTTKMNLKEELRLRENLVQNQILLNQLSTQSEVSKFEEQKRVNMEYVGFAQGISQVLSGIAGENEAIQKAALVFEKGAAIASIIVKAQTSIATSRAATSAANLNATMTYPYPFNLPIIAQNEALFLKNTALTKTGAGIGIAAILATAIGGGGSIGGSSGSGGAGGGAAVQAPDFNVVGASETSQLGMAIASTEGNSDVKLYWSDIDDMNNTNDRNESIVGF
jgi:hypothetical protein